MRGSLRKRLRRRSPESGQRRAQQTGRRATLTADIIAGISIALVLIPQSIAFADVAGLPAHIGLFAAALPPIAASFLASSPYLQTGPVAVTSLLTAGALAGMAEPGSAQYVALASLLALIVGMTRFAIGALHMGRIVYLMSEPMLRGFTSGAALLIVISQFPALLGLEGASGGTLRAFLAALSSPGSWDGETIAISASALFIIAVARRLHSLIPWALLVTGGGVAYSILTGYDGLVVGDIPSGFLHLTLAFPWQAMPALLVPGLVIALIGFAEAVSIARVFAARERQRWDPDRDFMSQGVANIAAAVSGAFPVGSSFSRSSLAWLLGGRTVRAGAIVGIATLAFIPFASILRPLPTAVLSAMVIMAVFGMIRVRTILAIWSLSKPQFLVASLTFIFTILLAPRIDEAVILGIFMAGVVHLWREFDLRLVSWSENHTLHVRPEGVLWFGSAEVLKQKILDLVAENGDANRLVLHMERVGRVDLTASLALESLIEEAREAGLEPEVVAAHPVTAKALHRVLRRRR
ncbi:MAG: SulP family inorganic anion transporter [Longimicrobiales bacterium]